MLHVPIVRDGTRMVCFIIHSPPPLVVTLRLLI